jgi:hypothetical protein
MLCPRAMGFKLLDPEDEGMKIIQNNGNYLDNHTASNPKRLESCPLNAPSLFCVVVAAG